MKIKKENNEKLTLTEEMGKEYLLLEEQIKALQARQAKIKNELLTLMSGSHIINLETKFLKFTVIKASCIEHFNIKKFKKDHEALYNNYNQIIIKNAYLKITKK